MEENKGASMIKKTALICGVSGHNGSYLAGLLPKKGYAVFGTSRDAQGLSFLNIRKLGIQDQITFLSMVPEYFRSDLVTLRKSNPDEIYYLAHQSSVGLFFKQPVKTIRHWEPAESRRLHASKLLY